jgi:hypothetical protein
MNKDAEVNHAHKAIANLRQ